MHKEIVEWAHSRGMLVVINSVKYLENANDKIQKMKSDGKLDPMIFKRYMGWYEKSKDSLSREFKSIIILALPRPAHTISFQMNKDTFTTLLPPTYVNYNPVFERYFSDFSQTFKNKLGNTVLLRAPLKTLAVKLGLAAYGKNNITYVENIGSYHQLMGFATEKELKPYRDSSKTLKDQLEQCDGCDICTNLCPTKAINSRRFLLHAERCLTFFNEREGKLPDDVHISSKLNFCFLGCMACQEFCPANKGLLRIEPTGVIFTTKETNDILKG
jgi:epoxyqueuosine reductase